MSSAYIRDVAQREGEEVTVRAWLVSRRSSRGLHFLQLRDGTGEIQAVVASDAVDEATFEATRRLQRETSLEAVGTVTREPRSDSGLELRLRTLTVVGEGGDIPVIQNEAPIEARLEHRHLWIRAPRQQAILRVRAALIRSIHAVLEERGFLQVDAPIFTPNAVEERTSLFETRHPGIPYLTQSGQLHNEAAAMAFGRVYSYGPVFRHERTPNPARHLSEFWMVEPEVAWMQLDELIDFCESFVSAVIAGVVGRAGADLELLGRLEVARGVEQPFARITYSEAIDAAREAGATIRHGDDLTAEAERLLSADRTTPLFVTHYPASVKPFYMKRDPHDPDSVLCADLLAPEGYGEILGGGEREDSLDRLSERLGDDGLNAEDYEWYLDLRRHGSAPHSGFGLGVERTVAWLCGLSGIAEAIPFPRLP